MGEEKKAIPRHIGFIMDGNGRWAKQRGKSRNFGHKKGADVIEELVEYAFNNGVEVISLYAFSTENWSRPQDEIDTIFELLRKFIERYSNKLHKEKIRLVISGDIERLPKGLKNACLREVDRNKDFTEHTVNIALNYGSKDEIVRACNLLLNQGKTQITENDLEENLYTHGLPDIDMIIRTSGEHRLSNFFLWQSAYAELYITDVLWPDFNPVELQKAMDWFSTRKRRFGGIGDA